VTTPTPEQIKAGIAGVFDRSAETYDSVGVEYFTAFGRRLVGHAALRPGERVLDLGCGRGAVTFAAAEAVGPGGEVLALDLAPGMVRRTAGEAAARGLGQVTVRVGDAEAPDVPEGAAYDAVLLGLVIFFLPDPRGALATYRGLLRDGGRLAMTTFPPQPDGGWGRVGKVLQRYLPGSRNVARPDEGPLASPEALAATLRDLGFADARSETESFDTAFRDLDHWWQWAWSHGQRAALERVPEGDLDALRAECYAILRGECDDTGALRLRQYVTYTVATV
jgi:ubiquinone/menaquinone biosynthesis C-methylase UbiE